MALVNVTNVVVLDNPTAFSNPLTFEVTFECLQELDADLEWKVIYVGSAEDTRYDQVLEEVDVGPIPVGVNKFVLTAESPDPATIPPTDLVGVTVTLITCCYKGREFIRVGYYVNNEHNDPAVNAEIQEGRIPPAEMLDPACITRNILADKPRVTRFPIDWNAAPAESGGTPEVNGAASEEGGMEVDEMAMTVEEEGVVYEEEGVVYEEEMGAGGDSTHIGAEGSESIESEGEDEGSVDLEEGEAADAMIEEEAADLEEDAEAEAEADSSGAEDMEDLAGDEARAGNAAVGTGATTGVKAAGVTAAAAAAPAAAAPAAAPAGVLAPTTTDQNVQPAATAAHAVAVVGEKNASCGADGNPASSNQALVT